MDINLNEDQQERIDIIRHKLKFIESKPSILCLATLEPLTVVSEDVSQLVAIAGGTSITGNVYDLPSVDPDIIVLMLQGMSVQQSTGEIITLLQTQGFSELKAVKNNRIYIIDAIRYEDLRSDRIVELTEVLAEIINPKQFIFGYEGETWVRFTL